MVVHCIKRKWVFFLSHLLEVELNGAAAILVHLIEDFWERAGDEISSDLASKVSFWASITSHSRPGIQPLVDWIWSIITSALAAWSVQLCVSHIFLSFLSCIISFTAHWFVILCVSFCAGHLPCNCLTGFTYWTSSPASSDTPQSCQSRWSCLGRSIWPRAAGRWHCWVWSL